ncbi:phospholipase D-like domain-containing protein [Aureimonas ureilytica]|uniref:phospholipase D-like domain-containing protein n=1 Tax=Aureimonas ureilytica TaxID=401562 RepID=UPI0009E9A160|nr:phospholipase D-like domain-containing protein [Aureimonas ureilytica]
MHGRAPETPASPPALSREAEVSPFRPLENCLCVAEAHRAALIIDADDYFAHARAAMLRAKRRIVLIGWDFDARIRLGRSAGDRAPEKIGDFIYWLVEQNPALEVFLLRWDLGALKTLTRGSTMLTVFKWMAHHRIHTKLDSVHPPGASHHQKIVVIDESLAFCGGIDMTEERWDTRAHIHHDPRRLLVSGKPHKPWHDATTAVDGPMALALAQVARDRWHDAGGRPMEPLGRVYDPWPERLVPHFENVRMAVSRSSPPNPSHGPILEIENLYLEQIAAARRVIYAESQYFASRRIAEAIAKRLDEEDGPEIVLINPLSAQGWLEPLAMDTARARLHEVLRRHDRHGRFRIYHPFTEGGDPIYVHAKILIVDDRILRVGSSNLNNRSMRLDTECDVTVDTALPGNFDKASTIRALRDDLLSEHLNRSQSEVTAEIERTGSLIAAIEALRDSGKSLRPYEPPELTSIEEWLADNEVLDPEGPDEMFEPFSKRGLFRRLRPGGKWRRKA